MSERRAMALKRVIALAEIPAARVGHETWAQYVRDAELLIGQDWDMIREYVSDWRDPRVIDETWTTPV